MALLNPASSKNGTAKTRTKKAANILLLVFISYLLFIFWSHGIPHKIIIVCS
jgi:hypothetical protein